MSTPDSTLDRIRDALATVDNVVFYGAAAEVIAAMTAIPGMRLDHGTAIGYYYTTKPGTKDVVEMMTLRFIKAVKS